MPCTGIDSPETRTKTMQKTLRQHYSLNTHFSTTPTISKPFIFDCYHTIYTFLKQKLHHFIYLFYEKLLLTVMNILCDPYCLLFVITCYCQALDK